MEPIRVPLKKDYLVIKLTDENDKEKEDELRFYYDDNTTKSFQKNSDVILKRIEDLEKSDNAETEIEDKILEEWFNYVFGDGAYDIIKKHQRSIINRKSLLLELSFLISDKLIEMKQKQEEEAAQLYEIAK